MNIYTLCFLLISFSTAISYQSKIYENIPQTNNGSSANIKMKVDTLVKIGSKLKSADFTLSIEPKNFNNSSMGKAKIIITNRSNEKIVAGLAYFVDFYEGKAWRRLNLHENIIFGLVAVDIQPYSARELETNLKILPYDYMPGRYRITKDVITSDKKRFLLSTEFSVSGADTNKWATPTINSGSKAESLQDLLSMTISPSVFRLMDFNKAKVILTNKSSYNLTAGDHYLIDYFNGKVWEKITLKNVAFNDMAYGLDAGSTLGMDVYLKPVPHDYKRGKYRISKRIEARDIGQRILVTTEFLIQ